jgi:glycolate oxidase iron-sulfur subunit
MADGSTRIGIMQIALTESLRGTPAGSEAEAILRRCVHCGFCTATCPTYQLLGDELDGPRGRIYLIKDVLEGGKPTRSTQQHLDRCLTCLNCETTCPSGVRFGRLVDIGRALTDERVRRPLGARLARRALVAICTGPWFARLLGLARGLRPLLPRSLALRIPAPRAPGEWPRRHHSRRVLLLAGCVQPALAPNIDAATARVLDRVGIEAVVARGSGCCGALRHHGGDPAGALDDMRCNIDAWWPHLESGAESILMNASGCGAMVRQYGDLLRHDPAYAARAEGVSAACRDLSEVLPQLLQERLPSLRRATPERLAFHSPCSLQHAQQIRGLIEPLLRTCGADLLPLAEAHLCCGSAGTYSLLEPALSHRLRERKLEALLAGAPQSILSANIGCIAHLAAAAPVPVRHWIEWIDARLAEDTLVRM